MGSDRIWRYFGYFDLQLRKIHVGKKIHQKTENNKNIQDIRITVIKTKKPTEKNDHDKKHGH